MFPHKRGNKMALDNQIKQYKRGSETLYLIDFHLRGFRVRQRGFISKAEASIVLHKIRTEILIGTYVPSLYKVKKKQSQMTFKELLAHFLKNNKSVKDSTKVNYKSTYDARMKKVFADKKLAAITGRFIDKFLIDMLSKYSSGYAGTCYTILKSVLGWAERNGFIEETPKFKKPKDTGKKNKRFLKMEEIRRMIDYASNNPNEYESEFLNMLQFAVLTGMRIGEIRALRLEDINFETKKITISRRIYKEKFGTPKNGKIQSIPLHRELEEVIQNQLELNEEIKKSAKWKKHGHIELFLSTHSGKRVSKHLFVKRLKSLSEKVLGSNEGVSPHTLRRSLSDYLIQSGMNISQVSGMLRNTSVVMLKHYSQQDIDSLSETFNTMNISKSVEEKNIGK